MGYYFPGLLVLLFCVAAASACIPSHDDGRPGCKSAEVIIIQIQCLFYSPIRKDSIRKLFRL